MLLAKVFLKGSTRCGFCENIWSTIWYRYRVFKFRNVSSLEVFLSIVSPPYLFNVNRTCYLGTLVQDSSVRIQNRCDSTFYVWCAQLLSTSTPLFTIFMWQTKSYLSPPTSLRLPGGPCVPAKTRAVPYRSGTVGTPQEWECGRR